MVDSPWLRRIYCITSESQCSRKLAGGTQKIGKTVKSLRRPNKSYTKTQWFIEAVNKKLEQEERKAKKLLVKFRDLASSKKNS
jgi:hypothetical protein